MIFERTVVYSVYNPYSIYFRMGIALKRRLGTLPAARPRGAEVAARFSSGAAVSMVSDLSPNPPAYDTVDDRNLA